MSFLSEYGLFAAKLFTVLIAIVMLLIFIMAMTIREKEHKHKLRIRKLNKKFSRYANKINETVLDKSDYKQFKKQQKQALEAQKKENSRRRIFVLDYNGDIKASGTSRLAESITAILTTATADDEVLLRLESPGGIVHAYGLAASQLKRLREKNIPFVVAIDKMAASGGYLMACVANRIIAAPFAVVGSVGVIAQMPNFNKLLEKNHITYEQVMAGEYKRTLSLFAENTNKDREKMQEDVENVHKLFKQFVTENRPQVDIDKVATGEHWHGVQALQLNLVDQLMTSDDYLLTASEHADIFELCISGKVPVVRKITDSMSAILHEITTYYLSYKSKFM